MGTGSKALEILKSDNYLMQFDRVRAAVAELEKEPAQDNSAAPIIKSAARELLLSLEASIDTFHRAIGPILDRLEKLSPQTEVINGTPEKGWSISSASTGTDAGDPCSEPCAESAAAQEAGTAAEKPTEEFLSTVGHEN